jgi:hypothetical protein
MNAQVNAAARGHEIIIDNAERGLKPEFHSG